MKYQIKYLYFSIVFFCFTSMLFSQQIQVGEKAYPLSSKNLEGTSWYHLKYAISNDKPIFINFFADWCSPCIEELPLLSDFHSKNKNDIEMIIINVNNLSKKNSSSIVKQDPVVVKKILDNNNIIFTSLFDKYALIAEKYGVTTLPHSVLIKDGIIVWEERKKLTNSSLDSLKRFVDDD